MPAGKSSPHQEGKSRVSNQLPQLIRHHAKLPFWFHSHPEWQSWDVWIWLERKHKSRGYQEQTQREWLQFTVTCCTDNPASFTTEEETNGHHGSLADFTSLVPQLFMPESLSARSPLTLTGVQVLCGYLSTRLKPRPCGWPSSPRTCSGLVLPAIHLHATISVTFWNFKFISAF